MSDQFPDLHDIEPDLKKFYILITSSGHQDTTTNHTRSRSRRLKTPISILLESFIFLSKRSRNRKLKKEYLRCGLIRGFKKVIRDLKKATPKIRMAPESCRNSALSNFWVRFNEVYSKHSELFDELSKTEAGPETDGKNKRKGQANQRTFNNAFCRWFFREEPTRHLFFYYTKIIFGEMNIPELKDEFNAACCVNSEHTVDCFSMWENLELYVQCEMLSELKLTPWFTESDARDSFEEFPFLLNA